jgi:hypothetical protein
MAKAQTSERDGRRSHKPHSRFKVVPVDEILWHVLDSVGQEKAVAMAVHALVLALVELDIVHAVAESELLVVLGNLG